MYVFGGTRVAIEVGPVIGVATLNVKKGTYDGSGHAMATRKGKGKLQFLDPNLGIMEFDNSLEFFNWLPQYLDMNYKGLLTQQAQVKRF